MGKLKELFRGRKKFLTIPIVALLGLFFFPITIGLLLGWLVYAKVGNKKLKFVSLAVIGLLTLFFGGTYTCNCSKTCPQMSSCAEAQYQLNTCGCTARDADHDGIACDSQCQ